MKISTKSTVDVTIKDTIAGLENNFICIENFRYSQESDWLMLEKALQKIRELYIPKDERCKTCDGSGEVHSHNPRCWTCDGTGRVKQKAAK